MVERYKNTTCPICRKPLLESEDVVVCPDCGAPHHRLCFLEAGCCAYADKHTEGFTWDPAASRAASDTESSAEKTAENPDSSSENVGFAAEEPDFIETPEEMMRRFERSDKVIGEDGVSMRELMAYSTTSLLHYATAFNAIRGMDGVRRKTAFFNLCGGLLAPINQFYRKNDFFGAVSIVAMFLASYVQAYFSKHPGGLGNLSWMLGIGVTVALCFFSDYFYYRSAQRKIIKFRENYSGDTQSDEYYAELSRMGAPSANRAILAMVIMTLIYNIAYFLMGFGAA